MTDVEIREKIFSLLAARAGGKTICPSEVLPTAQRKDTEQMQRVRAIARRLVRAGKIEITQAGRALTREEIAGTIRGPIRLRLPKSLVPFDVSGVDFRREPERYRVARGEQGVLSVEPYKGEILPHWAFRTPEIAIRSSQTILRLFRGYRRADDFVGMDMARKFLQMGFTRARRYANHRGGKKYVGPVPPAMKARSGAHGRKVAPLTPDAEKAAAAAIFREAWDRVEADRRYVEKRKEWKERWG